MSDAIFSMFLLLIIKIMDALAIAVAFIITSIIAFAQSAGTSLIQSTKIEGVWTWFSGLMMVLLFLRIAWTLTHKFMLDPNPSALNSEMKTIVIKIITSIVLVLGTPWIVFMTYTTGGALAKDITWKFAEENEALKSCVKAEQAKFQTAPPKTEEKIVSTTKAITQAPQTEQLKDMVGTITPKEIESGMLQSFYCISGGLDPKNNDAEKYEATEDAMSQAAGATVAFLLMRTIGVILFFAGLLLVVVILFQAFMRAVELVVLMFYGTFIATGTFERPEDYGVWFKEVLALSLTNAVQMFLFNIAIYAYMGGLGISVVGTNPAINGILTAIMNILIFISAIIVAIKAPSTLQTFLRSTGMGQGLQGFASTRAGGQVLTKTGGAIFNFIKGAGK